MNSTDIIRTTSKIFGFYFVIQTVMNLGDIFLNVFASLDNGFNHNGMQTLFMSLSYMAIFNLTVGLILIFKADSITEKIRPAKTNRISLNIDKTDWIELSLIVISGLTIIHSIPEIMYKVVNYIYFNDYDKNEKQYFWTNQNKANLIYSVFKFAVGLFFLLNARNFAGRLKRVGDKDDRLGE
jgi:Sec-independent protein secretion pathway component TatC